MTYAKGGMSRDDAFMQQWEQLQRRMSSQREQERQSKLERMWIRLGSGCLIAYIATGLALGGF